MDRCGALSSLSAFMDCLGYEASLTNDLTTPVKPTAAVFYDRHLLSPIPASAAEYVAASEIH